MASKAIYPSNEFGNAELAIDAPSRVVLGQSWPELIILIVALAASLVAAAEAGPLMDFMNLAAPTMLIVALSYGCFVMARRGVVAIWTPLFWVRVSFIAYLGVGSIVPYAVNEQTRQLIDGFYQFFPADVNKYNIVALVFFLALVAGSSGVLGLVTADRRGLRDKAIASRFIQRCGLDLKTMAWLLFAVGAIANYVFVLPYQLGLIDGFISQFAVQLALAMQMSFFLLTYWALRERSRLIYLIMFLVVLDSLLGLIQFAKSSALLPLIMASLGALYHKPRLLRLLALATLVTGYYFTITPIVSYARGSLANQYSSITGAPIAERVSIIMDYDGEAVADASDDVQLGWVRLSYVNVGSFAISQYDAGQPGNSLDNALIVFVPRLLYPDKPEITEIGRTLSIAGTGNANSAVAPGLSADLYWSAGFLGVIVGGLFIGALFALWSMYSITVMRSEAWHLLFIVLLGLRVGMSSDAFFVPAILGPLTFAVGAHIGLTLLNRLTLNQGEARPATV